MTCKYATYIKWVNVAVDYTVLNIALIAVYFTKDLGTTLQSGSEFFKLNILLLNLFWFYSSQIVKLYDNTLKRDAIPTIETTISCLILYLIILSALKLLFPMFIILGGQIFYFFLLFALLILVSKAFFLLLRRSKRRLWIDYEKIIIVGAGPQGLGLHEYIAENPQLGYKVEGIFDDCQPSATNCLKDNVFKGPLSDCLDFAVTNGIREIYCALPNRELDKIKVLMQEADKNIIRFRLVPEVEGIFNKSTILELYGHIPILIPRQEPLDNKANELLKRAFDIMFSSVVVIFLLSWVIPLIALIIKIDSKGPVFFKQLRSGRNNKPFYCLKFRSMTVNADSDSRQACKGDARVTKVGAFLRKNSLDELPQFINVLMGDMSVVGPRPHMLKHTQDYSLLINNFMVRHFLTPGITGWAQVHGYRGETKETTAMSKRVEADLWYLENWSLFLDVKIIFLTVWQAVRGNENAY